MVTRISREIHLVSRPDGWPTEENFRLVETEVRDPGPGQLLIRNRYVSVDPYMRGRMNDVKSYIPPFRLDQVLDGEAIGEVIASNDSRYATGDTVTHLLGWREFALVDANRVHRVDPAAAPRLSSFLGALGSTGMTAYVGLLDIAAMRPGDVVFISGAAGAVGSTAGQIAKLRGAGRVIGSAGSAAKVAHVKDLGFDDAFDYKSEPVAAALRRLAPDGIDVYLDNVGGDHLEAAIGRLRNHGRIAMSGAIAEYNASTPALGPKNLSLVISKRATMRGFIITDHADRTAAFLAEVGGWLRDSLIRCDETVVEGIDNAPGAFIGLLRGKNTGKMLVKVD